MSFSVEIEGQMGDKRNGISEKSGSPKPWWSCEVEYMGGTQDFFLDNGEEFAKFPEKKGTKIIVTADAKVGRDGKLRLSNPEVELVAKKTRTTAAAGGASA